MHVLILRRLPFGWIQSKWDFDGMAPYLFGALLVFFVSLRGLLWQLGEEEARSVRKQLLTQFVRAAVHRHRRIVHPLQQDD